MMINPQDGEKRKGNDKVNTEANLEIKGLSFCCFICGRKEFFLLLVHLVL